MIIDAHTHLFAPDAERYPVDPLASYRPEVEGSVELLRLQMDEAGVDRALTISPWPYRWDMSYVLDILPENRNWLAVGVLVDPFSPDGPDLLTRYVDEYGVCGLRIQGRILRMEPLDQPATTPLWQRASDLGITLDVNASQLEYSAVANRARQFPDLRIVLDHCGYVSSDLYPSEPHVEPVLRMAEPPNVFATLSFVGAASSQPYPCDDVHWMVRQIVDAFGPERCVFGSNFPTAQYNQTLSYAETMRLFAEAIELTEVEREWILGRTAQGLWRWG